MTDKEKLKEILLSIDKLRESQPLAAQFIDQILTGIKPQLDQLLKSEEEHS